MKSLILIVKMDCHHTSAGKNMQKLTEESLKTKLNVSIC